MTAHIDRALMGVDIHVAPKDIFVETNIVRFRRYCQMRNSPIEFVRWMAQTVHQAYHKDGTWETCQKDICASARRWIEDFLKDDKVWVTADKKVIPLREMEEAHLRNAYRLLMKKASTIVCKAHEIGVDIKPGEAAAAFPDIGNLRAEILRRESLKSEPYKGTRNLDI